MNSTQTSSIIDRAATVIATWFLTWLASRHYISDSDVVAFLPILVAIPAAFIGWYKNTATHIASAAAEVAKDPNSPIQGVITTNDTAGRELAQSGPDTMQAAGTIGAVQIAKDGNP